jgi:hypothetical protein
MNYGRIMNQSGESFFMRTRSMDYGTFPMGLNGDGAAGRTISPEIFDQEGR